MPLLRAIFPRALEMLLRTPVEDASAVYNRYGNVPEEIAALWKKYDDAFLQLLQSRGLELKDKTVLSVSDNPGFFSARIQHLTKRVLTTEFSEAAAAGMAQARGIQVRKFDVNGDRLEDVCEGETFDYVFFRSRIELTLDLRGLLESFSRVMNDRSVGIIMTHPPTAGIALEFMYTENMLWYLYNPETIVRLLNEHGFEMIAPFGETSDFHDIRVRYKKTNPVMNSIRRAFQIYYMSRAAKKSQYWPLSYTLTENQFLFRKASGGISSSNA